MQGVPPYECYIICVDLMGNSSRNPGYSFESAEEAQETTQETTTAVAEEQPDGTYLPEEVEDEITSGEASARLVLESGNEEEAAPLSG